jgi:hypothetical protein
MNGKLLIVIRVAQAICERIAGAGSLSQGYDNTIYEVNSALNHNYSG